MSRELKCLDLSLENGWYFSKYTLKILVQSQSYDSNCLSELFHVSRLGYHYLFNWFVLVVFWLE